MQCNARLSNAYKNNSLLKSLKQKETMSVTQENNILNYYLFRKVKRRAKRISAIEAFETIDARNSPAGTTK